MQKETEIKLRVSRETLAALREHPLLKKRNKSGWERRELMNQYFDTPERDLARAKRTRDVTVGVQFERNLQNAPTNSYGFGVSVPLFIWHEYEGEIARADADYNAARLLAEQQQAVAIGQVAQARNALLAARDRMKRLEGGLLADAERVAKAAELAYGKGAMSLMDLLDARRTLRQIQIEAASARADYAKALSDWQVQADYRKPQ